MTDQEDQKSNKTGPTSQRFEEEFKALPLDKKLGSLFRMEVETLGETISYVVNSPMEVVQKVGDVITEFGTKLESEARKAACRQDTEPDAETPPAAGGETKGRKARGPGAQRSQKP